MPFHPMPRSYSPIEQKAYIAASYFTNGSYILRHPIQVGNFSTKRWPIVVVIVRVQTLGKVSGNFNTERWPVPPT